MKIIETKFKDLKIFDKQTFKDNRGFFRELYLRKHINKELIFDVMSLSKKNVIRGLHLQTKKPQAKLITVLKGKIFDVCLDCRKNSKTFGKYFSKEINADNRNMIYVPSGFAHGFISLTDNSELIYLVSSPYNKNYEVTIRWNDPLININWPLKPVEISEKDKEGIFLNQYY